ncbi:hypothetical protein BDQ17DRAFT_1428476 [Cyathus striatus]|nr:hypothetical protein BDQ17DRAFT_1428476 [Cyathus striatus]
MSYPLLSTIRIPARLNAVLNTTRESSRNGLTIRIPLDRLNAALNKTPESSRHRLATLRIPPRQQAISNTPQESPSYRPLTIKIPPHPNTISTAPQEVSRNRVSQRLAEKRARRGNDYQPYPRNGVVETVKARLHPKGTNTEPKSTIRIPAMPLCSTGSDVQTGIHEVDVDCETPQTARGTKRVDQQHCTTTRSSKLFIRIPTLPLCPIVSDVKIENNEVYVDCDADIEKLTIARGTRKGHCTKTRSSANVSHYKGLYTNHEHVYDTRASRMRKRAEMIVVQAHEEMKMELET